MTATARLAGFAAVVATVFGRAAIAGGAIGANPPNSPDPAKPEHRSETMTMTKTSKGHAGEHAPAGLAIADQGLRLEVADSTFDAGRTRPLRFRVVDDASRVVRDFETEHGAKLHLIVVRRDLTGYQHLHPRHGATARGRCRSRFTTPARTASTPTSPRGKDPRSAPICSCPATSSRVRCRPANIAPVDGYTVALTGAAEPGRPPVHRHPRRPAGHRLQPYLGAAATWSRCARATSPTCTCTRTRRDSRWASVHGRIPVAGRYRLFLQFKHDGRVHTAAFTREVVSAIRPAQSSCRSRA